jgi:hypothetical protein
VIGGRSRTHRECRGSKAKNVGCWSPAETAHEWHSRLREGCRGKSVEVW